MRLDGIRTISEVVDRATQERRSDAVLVDRVQMLYGAMPLALSASTAVAILYVIAVFRLGAAGNHLHWLAIIGLVLALRGLSAWRYQRRRSSADSALWLNWYRSGASLTAGVWGVAGVLFFPEGNSVLQAITLLVLAGVTAGALGAMSADYATYRNFVLLALTPLIATTFLRGGELQILIGALGTLLAIFLLKSGRQHSQSIVGALTLQHENAALLADLETEKKRLLDNAETMMSTVLSTAPIALWSINNSGRITFMKGAQVDNQLQHKLPSVGENLFEAFPDHPQVSYETQRALDGEKFATEIEIDGYTFEIHYNPLRDENGVQQGAIGVAIDISDRIEHKKELSRRAHYDELTGLPNRTLIMTQIVHAFDNAKRRQNLVGLFFLDLDNFKAINDSLGHNAGDELLRQTSDRLSSVLRQNDMPARLGGDEFLVISESLARPEDAEVIAHKIARMFQRPFMIEQREIFVSTSIGIAIYPDDGTTAEALLRSADTAMYYAKAAGKNRYQFFTREMQDAAQRHLVIETEMRRALARNEMHLVYQPKYDAGSGRIRGAEALLRWVSPTLGEVSPADFVPVAEFAGLMPQIGEWVLNTACAEANAWQTPNDDSPLPSIAINVSPQQFRNTDLLADVTQALANSGITPERLELEITESVLVQDAPETMRIFQTLNELGVSLSLDDFGTGYSSLSYVKKFPMQVLKIDKSFVQDLGKDRDDDTLVDAIIAMAHSLRLQIVAEGVETAEQYRYLKDRKVELMQGYYFSKPVPADEFRAMLLADQGHARGKRSIALKR